jgi:hypothetical protein
VRSPKKTCPRIKTLGPPIGASPLPLAQPDFREPEAPQATSRARTRRKRCQEIGP